MIKQHCDICDGVIPNIESYRTVFFGRGTNPRVNTGYDPTIVCKKCWKKMLDGIGAGDLMKVLPDKSVDTAMVKTEVKKEERVSELAQEIADGIITGKDKSCASCVYGNGRLSDEPCRSCTGKDKWVERYKCTVGSLKCLDCPDKDMCDTFKEWSEEDE